MDILKVIILAIVQGLAELLPVSSSAHVVVAEKLMHLDPSTPQMTLLLVMLHTGTMFAVIAYFWKTWQETYFSSSEVFGRFAIRAIWASALTVVFGFGLKTLIEHTMFKGQPKAEIEQLFGRLDLIAPALAAAGLMILIAGLIERRQINPAAARAESPLTGSFKGASVTMSQAGWMGFVQGLALPFRGFSRSGTTISAGMMSGANKERAERFSFALAVILTPGVVLLEAMRMLKEVKAQAILGIHVDLKGSVLTSLLGAFFAFLAGLVALRWLSSWLESGKWYLFGIYCLLASAVVFYLHTQGY
jgi:undecaprenyl-diphosphatase